MLFDIINPSDPYTMEAPDLEIAACAVCLLGSGQYGLNELSGDKSGTVPMFPFGGHDAWFTKQFGRDFGASVDQVIKTRRHVLAGALASVRIGSAVTRREFDAELAKLAADDEAAMFLTAFHDKHRTSVNDIGRHAWALGVAILEHGGAPEGETIQ